MLFPTASTKVIALFTISIANEGPINETTSTTFLLFLALIFNIACNDLVVLGQNPLQTLIITILEFKLFKISW